MNAKIKKIIAVDFDGFLFEDKWPAIGAPMKNNITRIKLIKNMGNKLILWTCRTGKLLEDAILSCKKHGLEFDAVNENLPEIIEKYGSESRKISADIYLDDRAYNEFNQEVFNELVKR